MSDTVSLAPGTIFAGDFKVVRPLRSGGQGSLYVVEQLSTSKHRALKLMLPELVAQPTSRKRFELEAKIAARIQSDHVVESIASGVDADTGTPWLVMELLEGEDLAAHIRRQRHLPPVEVLEIFDQLCHALGEAHKQGIVHRDLKPENIFLAAARRRGLPFMVKVLDFGIARVTAEAKTQSGTTMSSVGTPLWMAPEQTEPGGRVGPPTDVWPLGLLAFRMLTGYLFWRAPYDPSASVMMLMAEAFMHPLPAASTRAAEYRCKERVPPGFDAWFARCVARNIDERFHHAAEAFDALEPVLNAVSGIDRPSVSRLSPQMWEAKLQSNEGRRTGPGMRTWEGAPELHPALVISDELPPRIEFPPELLAPALAPPTPRTPVTPPGVTAEQAPRVQASSRPAVRPPRRLRAWMGIAVLGALVSFGGWAWMRSTDLAPGSPRESASATAASAAAPGSVLPDASAPTSTVDIVAEAMASALPSEPTPGASGNTTAGSGQGARRVRKLCKGAGMKCLANDDCCDRTCRAWVCRANPTLQNPYGEHP